MLKLTQIFAFVGRAGKRGNNAEGDRKEGLSSLSLCGLTPPVSALLSPSNLEEGDNMTSQVVMACSRCKRNEVKEGYKVCQSCLDYGVQYRKSHSVIVKEVKSTRRGIKYLSRFKDVTCKKCNKSDFRIQKKSIFCNICEPRYPNLGKLVYPRVMKVRLQHGSPFVWLALRHSSLKDAKEITIRENGRSLIVERKI